MTWRLHEHVLRGKIDNRTRGRVTGEIWLSGIDQPLVLELAGDCAPDLAGCELSFENPDPISMTTKPPAPQQRGPAGDITAARKVRVFDVPIEEALAMSRRGERPPEHMANTVYLEWFSERSGRVMIESADYRLQISEPPGVIQKKKSPSATAASLKKKRRLLSRSPRTARRKNGTKFGMSNFSVKAMR